ncbi:MAG: DctP family TRAP transporter solute-binding subunit [Bacillota bacterium]|nr:DctP family TRAP transporter solute-binding subunit [Bacillota bacterium]
MKHRYIISYTLIVISFLLSTSILGCESRAVDHEQVSYDERIVIKFSHVVAENTPKGMAARKFAELTNERTNGRVEVQIYPNSQLYKDGEEIEALQAGRVQMIAPATAKITTLYPQFLLFDLPFLFNSYEHVYEIVDGPIGQELIGIINGHNMVGLTMWDSGFKQIVANKQIKSKEDFKGLNLRVMDSQLLKDQFRGLGASTVVLPFNEVYASLEAKTVDGLENSLSNIHSKSFHRVMPYITISNHGYLGYVVMANDAFWSSLPEDIKEIIEEVLVEVTLWQREIAMEQNNKSLRFLEGIVANHIYNLTREEQHDWEQAFVPVYRKYQNDIGTDLIQKIIAARPESLTY